MKSKLVHSYNDIICKSNLFFAWQEFLVGKSSKIDVQEFGRNLFDNVEKLHNDLIDKTYRHGGYHSFYINDPKRRHIHKACVKDRLFHHAIYRLLYPFFDKIFIHDSYSCRLGKGVYKALERFKMFSNKVSKNNTKTCYVLKCDIKKFFDSIDHGVLMNILKGYICDESILWLLQNIIDSYHSEQKQGQGLPLGNLTSQLFSNIYMNIFDQWIKHKLKAKYYIRYADDFVFFGINKQQLQTLIDPIRIFLSDKLKLTLHPQKISQKTIFSGVDFLGWVQFNHHTILRRKTKERMFIKLFENPKNEVFQSYLGLLSHGNTYKIENNLRNLYWLLADK